MFFLLKYDILFTNEYLYERKRKMYAIKTVGLTKKYGDIIAVNNLNLEIKNGEIFSLLGINGAGKTTAIRMLTCLTKSTSGDAIIKGNSINKDENKIKQIIGVSPQETAIAPNLTVKENLELICGLHGFKKAEKENRTKELAEKFNLRDVLLRKAGKLSGGWQRRVSIAMALISKPDILFLDEPTLGLDVIARSELWDIIKALRTETTVILTTHYMEEAEALSDRIGIISNGKLLVVGTADELKEMTNQDKFENAFVSIVRGDIQ